MNTIDIFEDFLRQINRWWDDDKYKFKLIDRPNYLEVLNRSEDRLIDILIGARRVGKTSILQSYINQLLRKVESHKIIYLPADLREVQERGIRSTLEFIANNFNYKLLEEELYVLIDEIQEIKDWQKDVKFLYDNSKIKFVITGSSSLILKNDTSKLTGRFLLQKVLPLNYQEFLKFTRRKRNEESLLYYLKNGGYPEYILNQNKTYLQQAIESTLYRELLDIYGIRNPIVLKELLQILADKITTPVSANRLAKDLNIDDKTVKFYIDYLKSVYLIYPVHRYSRSNKITKGSIPKYYFNDNGVLNLFGIRQRLGHMVENLVFTELLRDQKGEMANIYYDVVDGQELDFRVGDDYYEVKSKELDLADLEPYEGINKNINLVNLYKSDVYVPNVKQIELDKFIS